MLVHGYWSEFTDEISILHSIDGWAKFIKKLLLKNVLE